MSGGGGRCECDGHVHALSGSYVPGYLHFNTTHLRATVKDDIIIRCPGAGAAVLQAPDLGKDVAWSKLHTVGNGDIFDERGPVTIGNRGGGSRIRGPDGCAGRTQLRN